MKYTAALIVVCAVLGATTISTAATVAGGARHSVLVTPDGIVWTWGSNGNGQLGDASSGRTVPDALPGLTDAIGVAAGAYHTLVLRNDGTVWAFGQNSSGQLGDGTTTQRNSPVAVLGLANVIAIAAGDNHSVALTSDGRVWTWGYNGFGQLGDGTLTSARQPLLVASVSGVSAIGAGANHTVIVKSDGTVWGWGANGTGQLGDGSTTQRTTAVQMSGITGASAVSAGSDHTLVLESDGTVRAVGKNYYGQLGDGTTTQRTTSVAVSGLTGVTAIAAGQVHSLALRADGTAAAWGYNVYGELGDGTTTNRMSPVAVSGLAGIAAMSAGQLHTMAVSSTGVVWTWGDNSYGQLGDGTQQRRLTPNAISEAGYAWKVGTPVFSVSGGNYYTDKTVTVTCGTPSAEIHYTLNGNAPTTGDPIVASGGTVLIDQTRTLQARAWKAGSPTSDVTSALYTLVVTMPTMTPGAGTYTSPPTVTLSTTTPSAAIRYTTDGSGPTEQSALYTGSFVVGTSTTLKTAAFRTNWTTSSTNNATYTMRFGTLAAPILTPAAGTYTSGVTVTMSAMEGATIRYTTNGTTPTTSSPIYTAPLLVEGTQTLTAKAFDPDYYDSPTSSALYTIVVADPTVTPTAGSYAAGQTITIGTATLGATLRYTLNGLEPTTSDAVVVSGGTLVVGNFTLKVKAWKTGCTTSNTITGTYSVTGSVAPPRIAAGNDHSLAIREDGIVFAWGGNLSGQLGLGNTTQQALPTIVSGVTGATEIAAGQSFSLAVAGGEQTYGWGADYDGQIGNGPPGQQQNVPVNIGLMQVVAISAGGYHGLALKSDGTAWAWGYNSNGQVGDGSTTMRYASVAVPGLTNVAAVAAGDSFSLALTSDGTAWSWGNNGNGQLGIGSTTSRTTPGPITGLSGVTAIAAGGFQAIALLSDGTVRTWGYNYYGGLCDGTIAQRTAPVVAVGLSNVVAVAAGAYFSLALKGDGTVWSCGYNGDGRLGDGTTTNRSTPVQVIGLPPIQSIAAGSRHSIALAVDGSVWTWGNNSNGQLGDGTTTNRATPVQIAEAGMAWKIAAPVLSVATGLYSTSLSVTVTEADPGATVHYTTNGAVPTESDTAVVSGGTVAVGQSLALKARAFKPGAVMSEVTTASYELKVVAPVLTPATGAYAAPQIVTISTTTPDATLTFTHDGTEPTAQSTAYASPVAVTDTETLKARAYKPGWTASDSTAASYVISAGTVATPTITPAAGTFVVTPLVTLATETAGATIRYTLDGSDPALTSPRYVYPFLVDRSVTVKARAFLTGYTASAIASASYSLEVAGQTPIPDVVPGGERFATWQAVTVTGPAGGVLRYTTNGVDPTETDPLVPEGGTITVDRAQIIKVRAWVEGLSPSVVRRGDFVITGALAAGNQHSLALAPDGQVWAWGRGSEGELGTGATTSSEIPVASLMTDAIAIAGGEWQSLAVRRDGTVWGWGSNGSGRLGDGTTGTRLSPVQAVGLTDVVAVSTGYDHSLALKADGTVWAWGGNTYGQLGDGTTTGHTTAAQVLALTGITSIAAGEGFSLAVQRDGSGGGVVWAWGKNTDGQLGDGSLLPRSVPVRVIGLTDAVQVVAGRAFGVARMQDGSVRAWGKNEYAQLATLTGISSTEPLVVPGLAHIVDIVAGMEHALAIDDEGRVWGWGEDAHGQLGTQNYSNVPGIGAPQLVPGASAVLGAAAGWQQSILLRADGSVWATGGSGTGLGPETHSVAQIPNFGVAPNDWLLTDADGDGLPAWREYLAGLDPLLADTNGDGLTDGVDLRGGGASANPDDDGDGVPNTIESANGTDPFRADTDGDGISDLLDDYPLDPTRSQKPASNPNDTTPPVITLTEPTTARLVGGQ